MAKKKTVITTPTASGDLTREAAQEKAAVRRWLDGQAATALRIRQAAAEEGPNPVQAVAEALSAANALATMGMWPGPRDPASEAAVLEVRRRWARIQRKAKRARAV
jgi:hypothetical protein